MGDMADWAFDQIIWEEHSQSESRDYYLKMSDINLAGCIEDSLTDPYYEYNDYTGMAVDIYMSVQCGYKLSDKQKNAIAVHLTMQSMDSWY